MEASVYLVVVAALSVFALFWIIRLAVRYGVNDALRMNRAWLDKVDTSLRSLHEHERATELPGRPPEPGDAPDLGR